MNLIIDCSFCEPPSEISCFRDITLYSKINCFDDILVTCPIGTRTAYWNWLKSYGAHDYITYLIRHHEPETGILMHPEEGDIVIDKITCFNLNYIISVLNKFRRDA